jgi:hypothetical protein
MRDIDQRLLVRQLAVSRRSIPSCQWGSIADAIVADRQNGEKHLRKPQADVDRTLFGLLPELREKGVVVPDIKFDRRKIADVRAYLDPLPVYRGSHILSSDYTLRAFAEVQKDSAFAGYTVDQLLRAPHLVDFFNQPAIVDFIEEAMGCVPTLYSLNAWWSFPATSPTGDGMQRFHRDTDDWRFLTLFIYLTDVDEGAGPHQLVAGSHTLDGMTRLLDEVRARDPGEEAIDPRQSFEVESYFRPTFSAFVENRLRDSTVDIGGPAGTVFIANTVAIHRGLMPTAKPRLIVWARYGLGCNTNSTDLEQGPLARLLTNSAMPDTLRNRYVNRLLFEFDRYPGPEPEMPVASLPTRPAVGPPADRQEEDVILPPLPDLSPPAERSLAAARQLEASQAAQAPAQRPESGLAPKAKAIFRRLWDQASQGRQ